MSWRETTLGEITDLKRGFDLPKSQRLQGDVPVYSSSGITGSNSTAAVEGPCVITGRYGTIGEVFFSGGPCWPLNTALYSTEFNGNNPRFIYYLLQTIPWQGYTTASAVPGVNRNHVNLCPVKIPDRATQDAIVEVLDSIVDKIALNNRLNDYLSQICDAEFTDFVSNQRDASWHDGTLNELVEIRYGKDHKKLAEGPYPVYGSGGFMRSVEKPLSSGESVLIPRKGSLNNVMYVDEKFWTVDTMFFTIPLKPGAAKYVYQYTKRLDFGTMNSGSAVPSMTTKILNSLVIPIPSDSALVSFNKKLQPFFDLFGKNEEENRRLVSLRDILLPKLMSGEIDVSKIDLTQLTNNHLAGRMHWSNVIRVRAIHAVHSQQSQIPAYESVPKVSHSPCRTALTLGGIAPLLSWLAVSQFTAQSFAMLVVF